MEKRSISIQEEWIEVKKYNIPKGKFRIVNFTQNVEGIKIIVDDGINTVVEVFFDGIPLLWRLVEKKMIMRTFSEDKVKLTHGNTFFFEVKDSKLIQWAIDEGCGFYKESMIKHYLIATSGKIIDVLATFEPIVKIINAKVDTTF